MFILRGETESESCLVEVACRADNLRSAAAFVFVDGDAVTVWEGDKAPQHNREV